MLTLYDSEDPGIYTFRFPFSKDAIERLKRFPGCRYAPEYDKGVWAAPFEARGHLERVAQALGWKLLDRTSPRESGEPHVGPHPGAHPYQAEAALRAVEEWGLMLNFEMGLGKTMTAIMAVNMAFLGGTALVVCPAVVRRVWQKEIAKWDRRGNVEVRVITNGKDTRKIADWLESHTPGPDTAYYFIVSYDLLQHIAKADIEGKLTALIADECHMLANPKSGRSKAWAETRQKNLEALCLALTGTPIPDRVPQLAAQVNAVWPGRFGTPWTFTKAYHHCTEGEYGGLVVGDLKEHRLDELKERIAAVSVRVTKHEVAHLLPPITTQTLEVPWKREKISKAMNLAEENFGEYVLRNSSKRVKECVQWMTDTGQSHVCALTYHRDTAHAIAAALNAKGIEASAITGEQTPEPEQRHEMIEKALAAPQHYLVCTMSSVGIGVDALAGFSTAIFAELSYVPKDVTQAMARFYRLSSPAPVLVAFLVLRGTLDEVLMAALGPKIEQFAKTLKAGVTEEQLTSALGGGQESEEDWFARMREVAARGGW